MKREWKIALILLMVCTSVQAQDAQFSQFYSSPMYQNPALAGNTEQTRFSLNYRNQWASIPGAFKTYAIGYDQNLPAFSSGVGFMVLKDKAGTAGLNLTSINGYYSYTGQISRKVLFKAGLRFGYNTRGLDISKLTFGDQLARGGEVTTVENTIIGSVNYIDIGTGFVIAREGMYWAGLSIDHLGMSNRSLMEAGDAPIDIKYSLHGGYKIGLQKSSRGAVLSSVSFAANFKAQQKWKQLDIGSYFYKRPMIFGLWYRGIPILKTFDDNTNKDAFTLLIGYEIENMRIGYTYDFTVARLTNSFSNGSGGTHEIAIIVELASKRKRKMKNRKRFQVPCAKF